MTPIFFHSPVASIYARILPPPPPPPPHPPLGGPPPPGGGGGPAREEVLSGRALATSEKGDAARRCAFVASGLSMAVRCHNSICMIGMIEEPGANLMT